jgi:hypothetical protein
MKVSEPDAESALRLLDLHQYVLILFTGITMPGPMDALVPHCHAKVALYQPLRHVRGENGQNYASPWALLTTPHRISEVANGIS